MAIVSLLKMTLYGAESQKATVIDDLQDLGCAHLVDLGSRQAGAGDSVPASATRTALKYLRDCGEQRRQVKRPHGFDPQQLVAEVLQIRDDQQRLMQQRDDLEDQIEQLEPWGEFSLGEDRRIGQVALWFYILPVGRLPEIEQLDLVWREINRDQQQVYVVVLSETEPASIPGQAVLLPTESLSVLRARLEETDEQLEELHHQRVGLTRWRKLLSRDIDSSDDADARSEAAARSRDGSRVFAIQAWIPETAQSAVRKLANQHHLALALEPPQPEDSPPTLLHNPESVAGSEGLVTFYKTPSYGSWDPSIVAYVSFAIFFAMILADAGYGFVLAVITACLWKRMGDTLSGRRNRNVLLSIVVCTIVYGVLCGSYFGVTPPENSWLGKLKLLDAQSQALMMPLTILIGVVHLSLAHVVTAWLNRGKLVALASLGWIAVMLGATALGVVLLMDLASSTEQLLMPLGAICMVSGLVAVFLFSSERPWLTLDWKTHALRIVDGLQGLTGVSGLFGDVLSYLRLFALGLSSAKLSETFNDLGASAWDAAGFGVVASIAIVILGHTLNLLLSVMSGVVHGLRLNCIEFFKYGLPDEGYAFKTFEKKARQP